MDVSLEARDTWRKMKALEQAKNTEIAQLQKEIALYREALIQIRHASQLAEPHDTPYVIASRALAEGEK